MKKYILALIDADIKDNERAILANKKHLDLIEKGKFPLAKPESVHQRIASLELKISLAQKNKDLFLKLFSTND